MENNKSKIEEDFKNFLNVVKNHFKEQYHFLDFKFLKNYDKDQHIRFFLIYNLLYVLMFIVWGLLFLLGFEFKNGFSIIKFTMDYFFTGELITISAWRIHLVINLILFFMSLDYGKTEKRKYKKFQTREENLEKYRRRGWKFPNKTDGK